MAIDNQINKVLRTCLQDMQVELDDEFDRNFSRQAFFSERWQRRKPDFAAGRGVLTGTGALRRSILSRISGTQITFHSDLPYAGIHNEGGTITVTKKMKGYFWWKYKEATGSLGRTKSGGQRNDKRNRAISAQAAFFKAMALKKVGSKITIPRRQFLGTSPEVETSVRQIIERNLTEFFNSPDFSATFKN